MGCTQKNDFKGSAYSNYVTTLLEKPDQESGGVCERRQSGLKDKNTSI